MSDSNGPNLKVIIALAGAIAVGLVLNILACVLYNNNFLPIFVVIAYFFAPMPNIIFGRCADSMDVHSRWKDLGYFITGILIVSGFALPAVFAHSLLITWQAFGFAVGGGVIVYVTLLVYLHVFHKRKSDDF